ncbi:MAG: NAD-dependent epimerase/dehydratase family protein [Alphaproteobacteria bacterium]
MSRRRALVAGATGLVGKAVAEYFLSTGEADVVAVSRRDPQLPGALHVPLDLTDAGACAELLGGLDGITHIVFAALFEKPDLVAGWRDPEQMSVNLTMLVNLLDAVEQNAPTLEHVSILQGTKACRAHSSAGERALATARPQKFLLATGRPDPRAASDGVRLEF